MPRVVFVAPDGAVHEVDVEVGRSVMEAAVAHGVPGIAAECNGAMACATCHVFLDAAGIAAAGPPGEAECDMLDFAAVPRRPTSRLACQVTVTAALDGARVEVPERQN